jgi:flagellar protein FliJ
MKSRETLIRLKKFQVDEKRRRVTQIEGMIADFQRMSVDLEREIQSEQERAGINDPSHFAYPTYAKAAIQRRENLTRSADELRVQLEDARTLLSDAFEELKKVELLDERDQARERAEESAREQADLDSIGLMRARLGAGREVRAFLCLCPLRRDLVAGSGAGYDKDGTVGAMEVRVLGELNADAG